MLVREKLKEHIDRVMGLESWNTKNSVIKAVNDAKIAYEEGDVIDVCFALNELSVIKE